MMRQSGLVLGLLVALVMMPTRLRAQSLEDLSQQAGAAERAGNYTQIENIARKAIQLYPNNSSPYFWLGNALYDQKKLEEAIAAYRKAIELDPKNAAAYNNLGNRLSDLGKKEEAIAAYRKAIELDSKYAYAYNNLGSALSDLGKKEEAIAAYLKAIELDSKYAHAYNNLGSALSDLGKKEEAISAYRKAIELNPKFVQAYYCLASVLSDLGKKEEAITTYREVIEINPKDAKAYYNLGILLFNLGKEEEAISVFLKSLSLPDCPCIPLASTHSAVHNHLGWIYQQRGKLNEAIQEYEAALKIDPNFEYAQNNLKEAQRLLAQQQQPIQLIALNEIKYLSQDDPLTPIKRSIVKIKIDFPGNAKGASYGTGYVIKRQGNKVWIITNRHVVIDKDTTQIGTNLEIEPYYGETLPNIRRSRCTAKIVQVSNDDNLDLALLETTQLPNDIQPLTLEANPPNPNSSVTIIGHPDQSDWLEHQATFMSIKPSSGNLLIDVNLGKGASGSPILDPNRKVIGIMVRTVNESNTNSEAIGIGHPINLVLQQIAQWGIQIP